MLIHLSKIITCSMFVFVSIFIFSAVKVNKAYAVDSVIFNKFVQVNKINSSSANFTAKIYPRGYVYPMKELGNCDSKNTCFTYCDKLENAYNCSLLAEANGTAGKGSSDRVLAMVNHFSMNAYPSVANRTCDTMSDCVAQCDLICGNRIADAISVPKVLGSSTDPLYYVDSANYSVPERQPEYYKAEDYYNYPLTITEKPNISYDGKAKDSTATMFNNSCYTQDQNSYFVNNNASIFTNAQTNPADQAFENCVLNDIKSSGTKSSSASDNYMKQLNSESACLLDSAINFKETSTADCLK